MDSRTDVSRITWRRDCGGTQRPVMNGKMAKNDAILSATGLRQRPDSFRKGETVETGAILSATGLRQRPESFREGETAEEHEYPSDRTETAP